MRCRKRTMKTYILQGKFLQRAIAVEVLDDRQQPYVANVVGSENNLCDGGTRDKISKQGATAIINEDVVCEKKARYEAL